MFSKKKRQILLGLALSLAVLAAPVVNADQVFVKLEGIEGESTAREELDKAIDVLSWSWGVSRNVEMTSGRMTAERPQINSIVFTHHVDNASIGLMKHLFLGTIIPQAKLYVFTGGTDVSAAPYLIIELTDVMVSSIDTGGASSDDRALETVSLQFSKVLMKYYVADRAGKTERINQAVWDQRTQEAR